MTHDEIRTFVDGYVKAWEHQDIDALVECYTEDAEIISPMYHQVKGKAAIEASLESLFHAFGDFSFEIHDVIIDTEDRPRVALVLTSHNTHRGEVFGVKGTGRQIETQVVFVLHLADGRIAFERRMYDFTLMLVQLGVLKAKGMTPV